MIERNRLKEMMEAQRISQSELARRVGTTQATIYKLLSGTSQSSKYSLRIARELGTTAAYLHGEIDDPLKDAPPPRPAPAVQHVLMPVALPCQEVLAECFKGLLAASRHMDEGELAHELALQLPTLLRIAGGAPAAQYSDSSVADPEGIEVPAGAPLERRRA